MPQTAKCQDLSVETIGPIAAWFHVLGDSSRLKLIIALKEGERNVSELVEATRLNQPNVSRHLRTLIEAGVLTRQRKKREVYYSLAIPEICELMLEASRGLN